MTHPHPAQARTRKPETVLRELDDKIRWLYVFGGWDRYEKCRPLLRELRRSLRDTRGAK